MKNQDKYISVSALANYASNPAKACEARGKPFSRAGAAYGTRRHNDAGNSVYNTVQAIILVIVLVVIAVVIL